ncbi:MAG: hypothetical protein KDA84_27295, partial [Planctomycetaceae bacterium]|nr:hypothetical protein [Planctomycetaceae bacterium]
FQFEDRWQQFGTREEGIKAIVKETPMQVMRYHWKQMAFLACALVFLGLSYLPWNEYYLRFLNERDYQKIHAVWVDMQKLKAENAPPPEWRKLQNRAHRELTPLVKSLEKRAGRQTRQAQLAQALYMAVQHNILKHLLVKQSRLSLARPLDPKLEVYWQMTAVHMEKARLILVGKNPDRVSFPNTPLPGQSQGNEGSEDPNYEFDIFSPDVLPAIAEKPNSGRFTPGGHGEPLSPGGHGEPLTPGGHGEPLSPGGHGEPLTPSGHGEPSPNDP